jgi:hypothetical protein
VQNNRRDIMMKKVKNPVVHSLVTDAKLIDAIGQQIDGEARGPDIATVPAVTGTSQQPFSADHQTNREGERLRLLPGTERPLSPA